MTVAGDVSGVVNQGGDDGAEAREEAGSREETRAAPTRHVRTAVALSSPLARCGAGATAAEDQVGEEVAASARRAGSRVETRAIPTRQVRASSVLRTAREDDSFGVKEGDETTRSAALALEAAGAATEVRADTATDPTRHIWNRLSCGMLSLFGSEMFFK